VTPVVEDLFGGTFNPKTDVCDGSRQVLLTVLILGSVKFIRCVPELLCVHTGSTVITLSSKTLILYFGGE
jgi:hypothetical protein